MALDLGPLDGHVGYLLRRAQLAVFADIGAGLAAHAMSPADYAVLTVIDSNPGAGPSQVAETLGIQKTNFVPLIRRMEARGLVLRTPSARDRRSVDLTLTEDGKTFLATLHAMAQAHVDRVRDHLGPAEYEALLAPLQRLARLTRPA
ncbi:MAG: MarR family winged helix-turn-helix transcriptional regulator [Phreatobacter sp.]|nr:MarR family winged helix-turn-helix transcriptional regulator [Phreatobacter sp.]